MIAYLSGNFSYKSPAVVYVDVNGVGYEVNITLNTYSHIQNQEKGTLYTYLQVKEDGHTLYGFSDLAEKAMFVKLIGINGVGAATARMMLSSLKPDDITRAILQSDTRMLEAIKGIGKKTAERIVLELRDKLGKGEVGTPNSALIHNTLEQDALIALQALGISRPAAENALKKVLNGNENYNLEQLIKKALQSI
ncbi:MAG TPA: Holliday junction branch migration protein RuvA [Chitinophagaceae bacterium]|nr:Holliday junction branch migration protein RuvA [Chitinophagaceae bacterium]